RRIVEQSLHKDMNWTEPAMRADFEGFLTAFHDHLHGLAKHSVPLGLHTLGVAPSPAHRLSTVGQQLGDEFAVAGAAPAPRPAAMVRRPGHVMVHAGAAMVHTPGHKMGSAGAAMPMGKEFSAGDAAQFASSPPYRLLHRHLREQVPAARITDPTL